ncbi:MAG TPA: phosphoribosylformylglycinamidine cyclo-ligase [Victivallales bacterium]|nr:phosphoribosylformylglycinamidine cyclo-ligase [Victivallales bacterium]
MDNKISYSDAGVDIDLAQNLLKKVKSKIALAKRPEMLAPVGGFGGLFQLDLSKYNNPVLVSSIDGIGTKILVAIKMGKFDTLGYDIVHHCINDIAVQGAEPLYFLDYFGTGKLKSPQYEEVLCGIADACANNNCALLGGETAEMPGMYGDDFDLVGVINGVVDKDKLITGEHIDENCIAIGLNSNGLHTNGYSLARKVLFEAGNLDVFEKHKDLEGDSVGEALLKPHTCYWKAVKGLFNAGISVKGIAHITGGGLYDNVPRILPEGIGAEFYSDALPVPPIFKLIQKISNIDSRELYRTFNMGIGMIFFVDEKDSDKTLRACTELGYKAAVCGKALKNKNEIIVN